VERAAAVVARSEEDGGRRSATATVISEACPASERGPAGEGKKGCITFEDHNLWPPGISWQRTVLLGGGHAEVSTECEYGAPQSHSGVASCVKGNSWGPVEGCIAALQVFWQLSCWWHC
jgi:hypothetical protein